MTTARLTRIPAQLSLLGAISIFVVILILPL
jgi:hypothetical protein